MPGPVRILICGSLYLAGRVLALHGDRDGLRHQRRGRAVAPPSPARNAWEKVPEGRMRADARTRGGRKAARQSSPNAHPRLTARALIRRLRATFSRRREKD
jgi:hypothetical protein